MGIFKKHFSKLVIAFSLFAIMVACESNTAPIITNLSSSSEVVGAGEMITLICQTNDENGDEISYLWTSDGGIFQNNVSESHVEWKAPMKVGVYTISIVVSDNDLTTEEKIYISVQNISPIRPSIPTPANAISNVSLADTLFWKSYDTNGDTLKYGVYFGTDPNPPIVSTDGDETFFVPGLLKKDTKYYWRVNVQDNHGNVIEGPTWQFTTFNTRRTFTDQRDNSVYRYRTIGTQNWMLDNLNYLPAVNPDNEESDSVPHYYVLGYDGNDVVAAKNHDYYKTYGVLYNWEAAKKACPQGWHLPSDDEWTTLERYMGMTTHGEGDFPWRYSTDRISQQLKSTEGWSAFGNGIDSEGFRVLPGSHHQDHFYDLNKIGYHASFWSSSNYDETYSWGRAISSKSNPGISRKLSSPIWGYSVRCVR